MTAIPPSRGCAPPERKAPGAGASRAPSAYPASPIKRRRATHAEMEARAEFLIAYATEHAPVTVRQLYYAATVANVAGIDKTEAGYDKVQAQVLELRRAGRLPYHAVADATRWMRKPETWDSPEAALRETARFYRKALWGGTGIRFEIWLEKDALAGAIAPVTTEYDVPLMVTRGYTSETFAWSTVEDLDPDKVLVVRALYDFDRAGQDAARSLKEKLTRFAAASGKAVDFALVALTAEMVREMKLPTRPPKRQTEADRRWPHSFACELDALPPAVLREIVRMEIEDELPAAELAALRLTEAQERATLLHMTGVLTGGE